MNDDASDSSLPTTQVAEDDQAAAAIHSGKGSEPPSLILVATPIGNLGDITLRGMTALREANAVLCEDTRVTGRLMSHLGIDRPMQVLHDHNEEHRAAGLVAAMKGGARYALVSDAGTPLLSDPGYRLVRAAIEAGLVVSAVPGANAALTALTLSGLAPHPYLFVGFPPPRSSARKAAFSVLLAAERAGLRSTMIWHEAPHRLDAMLADLAEIFGPDRPAAVARELTKRFEEVRRDSVGALAAHYASHAARGEISVVLAPPGADHDLPSDDDLDAQLRRLMRDHSLKDAAQIAATASRLPRRVVYARALTLAGEAGRNADDPPSTEA